MVLHKYNIFYAKEHEGFLSFSCRFLFFVRTVYLYTHIYLNDLTYKETFIFANTWALKEQNTYSIMKNM